MASFLLIAACAGFVEELLFRGVLQPHLGLWITSFLFGLCHALSTTYFLVAAGLGLYLGLAYEWSGGNLLVPMLIHGIYDFGAFLLYRRRMRADSPEGGVPG